MASEFTAGSVSIFFSGLNASFARKRIQRPRLWSAIICVDMSGLVADQYEGLADCSWLGVGGKRRIFNFFESAPIKVFQVP